MITITPRGPFSLAAATRFLEGFTPAAYPGDADGRLRLAFPAPAADGGWRAIGAIAGQPDDSAIAVDSNGGDEGTVEREVARILSLDVDGSGFEQVGAADPVAGALIGRYPGLRPVCFHSPYEAAAWAVIGNRIRMTQAAAIKQRIAELSGDPVELDGRRVASFPTPQDLLEIDRFPGLTAVKVERLHAVASAALDGALDPARLRSLPVDTALTELQRIPGIGPFAAELILVRGAGHPDVFPTAERRLHAAMAEAYDLNAEDVAALEAVAEKWRPFRSWVALLFRASREESGRPGSRRR